MLQLFSPLLADLAASFATDSSKRLWGVFKRSFSTGFVSFEERRVWDEVDVCMQ